MRKITIVVLILLLIGNTSATIINVPDDQSTIQLGIDTSSDGDTVLVQPGAYVENINYNGHNIVLGSLYLTTEDANYISQTIIDGDSLATVVTFENGENNTAKLIGLTIQNGLSGAGGGIVIRNSSSPKIIKNDIVYNFSIGEWIEPNNIPPGAGGGIAIIESSPTIHGCRIIGNWVSMGIDMWGNGHPGMGGAIYSFESEADIIKCLISNNYSNMGGGIMLNNSNAIITANLICNNEADVAPLGVIGYGGGIYCYQSNPLIINNTITGNYSNYGGGLYCDSSLPRIINTVFWTNNAFYEGNEFYIVNGSYSEVSYSDIQGGWDGESNIDLDPLFRDPENADYHLMSIACGDTADSPCIDAGYECYLDSAINCLWGLATERSDIGAYGGGIYPDCYPYLPGDVNMANGAWPPSVIGGDVTYLVNYFRGLETSPSCLLGGFWGSADANGDCQVIGSDVTRLVNYFRGQTELSYCPEYEPAWPTPGDLPEEPPPGWPNCE